MEVTCKISAQYASLFEKGFVIWTYTGHSKYL